MVIVLERTRLCINNKFVSNKYTLSFPPCLSIACIFQHPRVRYAACNAVGQMSTDFAPVFEKKFHDKVIPGLLMVLDDNANPRVQAHAGAALVNFSEDCPKHILTPYLDAIMAKLESILTAKFQELVEKGTKLVLEQVRMLIKCAITCNYIRYELTVFS